MTHHAWWLTTAAPPPAWAALVADAKVLLAVARQRGITITGPTGTGQPILDGERIALAVRAGASSAFSTPFVFSRTLPAGELDTTDSDLYDSLVLVALGRARRYFGALLTTETNAGPGTVAQAGRLTEVVFGAADRTIDGRPAPDPRQQVDLLVGSLLDDITARPGDPLDVVGFLSQLLTALTAAHDGLAAAEAPPA